MLSPRHYALWRTKQGRNVALIIRKRLDQDQKLPIRSSHRLRVWLSADRTHQRVFHQRGMGQDLFRSSMMRHSSCPIESGTIKSSRLRTFLKTRKSHSYFFIPGIQETLSHLRKRLNYDGSGIIKICSSRKESLSRQGLSMKITKSYFHCGKALIRSKLWNEESHIEKGVFPSFGKMAKEEASLVGESGGG